MLGPADGRQHEEPGVLAGCSPAGDGAPVASAPHPDRRTRRPALVGPDGRRLDHLQQHTALDDGGLHPRLQHRTQVVVARAHGRTACPPTWAGTPRTRSSAATGVLDARCVVQPRQGPPVLDPGPQHSLDPSVRFEGAISGLTRAHLPNAACSCSASWAVSFPCGASAEHHLGPVLATGWLVGITGAQFMGLMATHFIPRYALVLLIPAPLLIAGAVAIGARRFGWVLPPAAVAITSWPRASRA